MEEPRDDLRVTLTKELLKKSILTLMEKHPIAEISVSQLCRHAKVNRGTFYKHYATPIELLKQIQGDLFSQIKKTVEKTSAGNALEPVLEEIFRSIADNSDLCRIILGKNGDEEFLSEILEIAFESAMADWKRRYKSGTKSRYELSYTFISAGSLGVIRSWIAAGFKLSPAEIAGFIGIMSDRGLSGVLQI